MKTIRNESSQLHLSQIIGINPTGIIATQNCRNAESSTELSRETRSSTRSSISGVAKFLEHSMFSVGNTCTPDLPTGTVDNIRHFGVLEADCSILAPWTSEINRSWGDWAGGSWDGGFVDHIVRDISRGCLSVGCNGTCTRNFEIGAINPSSCMLTKDEIHRSFNVAFPVHLISCLCEECVLVSVKSNTIVSLLVTPGGECDGLRTFPIGVLDVDVVETGAHCPVLHCSAGFVVRSARKKTWAMSDGHYIFCVRACVGGVSVDGKGCFSGGNDDLLVISASKNEKTLSSCRCCAQRINSSLDLSYISQCFNFGKPNSCDLL